MFAKLLKYEMRSVAKVWWFVPIVMLLTSVGAGISFGIMANTSPDDNPVVFVVAMLCAMASYFAVIFALAGGNIASNIIIYVRYYTNLFTDQGYLTFTLPVSRKQILGAKTVNAMIWTILTTIVFVISIMIIVICVGGIPLLGMASAILYGIKMLLIGLNLFNFGGFVLMLIWALEGLLLIVASSYMSVQLLQFYLTFGATMVRKLKLLVSFGLYYVVTEVSSFIAVIGMYYFMLSAAFSNTVQVLANPWVYKPIITFGLLLATVAYAAIGMLIHFINIRMLERKLNLA